MALGKMSEPEMVIPSLNPGGEVDCTRVDPKMVIPGLHPGGYMVCTKLGPEVVVVKLNLVAELSDSGVDPKPRFNKQKLGSVIPKQRKLVKLQMFERLAQFLRHVFCPSCVSSSGASSLAKKSFCCFKNGNPVHPHPHTPQHC
ncbi:hypothetical protein ACB094_12G113900 [Castanea mollissima]